MPTNIGVGELRDLLDKGNVQLVEVLPESEYNEEHLPGAISVPLKSMTPDAVASFDRSRPTVVYCWDDL